MKKRKNHMEPTNQPTDGRTDAERTEGQKEGWTEEWMDSRKSVKSARKILASEL